MKRIVSLILIALSIFSIGAIDTQAATDDISWSIINTFQDYHVLLGEIDIPETAYGMELYVPESDFHVYSIGGIDSFIEFRNAANQIIFTQDLIEVKTSSVAGAFIFNFIALDIEDAASFKIQISQTYTSIPAGYLDYINTNDDLMFNYDYGIELIWNNINLYSNYYSIQTNFPVVSDAKLISIYIPESQYHTREIGGVQDEINFYNANGTLLESIRLSTLNFNLISGLYKIDIENDLDLNIGQIQSVNIVIPQTYEIVPPNYIQFLNENSVIGFNDRVYRVNYYLKGDIYLSDLFNFIPEQPNDPLMLSGEYFEGWYFANGNEYDFNSVITDTQLFNNELNLYALITNRAPIDTDLGDPEPSEFFGSLFDTIGMNSTTGYAIMYLIVIILALVGLKSINVPNIMMMITMILITAIFMFMGFLPVLMGIVAFGVFALILFSGGGL